MTLYTIVQEYNKYLVDNQQQIGIIEYVKKTISIINIKPNFINFFNITNNFYILELLYIISLIVLYDLISK
jgi:hypothetical protein